MNLFLRYSKQVKEPVFHFLKLLFSGLLRVCTIFHSSFFLNQFSFIYLFIFLYWKLEIEYRVENYDFFISLFFKIIFGLFV